MEASLRVPVGANNRATICTRRAKKITWKKGKTTYHKKSRIRLCSLVFVITFAQIVHRSLFTRYLW